MNDLEISLSRVYAAVYAASIGNKLTSTDAREAASKACIHFAQVCEAVYTGEAPQ